MTHRLPSGLRALAAVALLVTTASCASRAVTPPADGAQPDQFLFERGNESLKEREWVNARTYYQQIVDGYPQSPVRPDAKLGMGDAYLGENSADSLVSAGNEYREFLQFYPTHPRADYAQYKIAMTHFVQMKAADRDQSETRQALAEFEVFFQKFPNSTLTAEVKESWRAARDRLSENSFRIGMTYYRQRWYPGAIDRFREVLRDDPGFSERDKVYFHLAESLARTDQRAEAIPYFERLLAEFEQSEYLPEARQRLDQLKIE